MDTTNESPQEIIVKMLELAHEAAKAGDFQLVNDICEQTVLEIKEISNHWGDSGVYEREPLMRPDYQDPRLDNPLNFSNE